MGVGPAAELRPAGATAGIAGAPLLVAVKAGLKSILVAAITGPPCHPPRLRQQSPQRIETATSVSNSSSLP